MLKLGQHLDSNIDESIWKHSIGKSALSGLSGICTYRAIPEESLSEKNIYRGYRGNILIGELVVYRAKVTIGRLAGKPTYRERP